MKREAGTMQSAKEGELLARVPLRLAIWDRGAERHRECPGLTELGCLALVLLEEICLGDVSSRWPWLRVDTKLDCIPRLRVFPEVPPRFN